MIHRSAIGCLNKMILWVTVEARTPKTETSWGWNHFSLLQVSVCINATEALTFWTISQAAVMFSENVIMWWPFSTLLSHHTIMMLELNYTKLKWRQLSKLLVQCHMYGNVKKVYKGISQICAKRQRQNKCEYYQFVLLCICNQTLSSRAFTSFIGQ